MSYCKEKNIIDFFLLINNAEVKYLLLRNIDNELPTHLPINKDIDLLVDEAHASKFRSVLLSHGWKQKRHPLGHLPFLYGIKPFQFYFKDKIHLDISYQLACRSLNKGEWFPLDMKIQEDLWKDRVKTHGKPWEFQLSSDDEFVHLLTRCIFDKKEFNKGYIGRIEELMNEIDLSAVQSKLKLVFFNYSSHLFDAICNKEYSCIIANHLKFKGY